MKKEASYEKIITRFAPSPTGKLHIGGARTALFNHLFSKKHGGKMILRIEDTDQARSKKEFEDDIFKALKWLAIEPDETYRQSERQQTYATFIKKMIDSGAAYVSQEKTGQRSEVIRYKNPNKKITFDDIVRGQVTFETEELGDFVIARSFNEPLYHLAAVIDDYEMQISHVIRGEDHISNTPRQILIQEGIGAPRPIYAHIPMILASDRSKMSKRHGAVAITDYKEKGYLPEALINYLALLGWNPGGEKELFTLGELEKLFKLEKVQRGGAVWGSHKLHWFQKEHEKLLPAAKRLAILEEAINHLEPDDPVHLVIKEAKQNPALQKALFERIQEPEERASALKDFVYCLTNQQIYYEPEKIVWKETDKKETIESLLRVIQLLDEVPERSFDEESVRKAIWEFAIKEGKGKVLWPVRYALSSKEKSPDPFLLSEILGKETTINRLKKAVETLKKLK